MKLRPAIASAPAADSRPQRVLVWILSLFLTLFAVRFDFVADTGPDLDGAWMRVLDLALARHWIFGRQIIFTYGPLAFLDTNILTTPGVFWQLLADVLAAAGFLRLFIAGMPARPLHAILFTALALPAVVAFRWCHFAQVSCMLAILYTGVLLLRHRPAITDYLLCALFSTTVFFVKLNFGIVTLFLAALTTVVLLWRRTPRALLLPLFISVLFVIILLTVRVDIPGYLRYGFSIVAGYDEAMFLTVDTSSRHFRRALLLAAVFLLVAVAAVARAIRCRQHVAGTAFFAATGLLFFYLCFKNSFIRCDRTHMRQLFAAVPLFMLLALAVTGFSRRWAALLVTLPVTYMALRILPGFSAPLRQLSLREMWSYANPAGYYRQLCFGLPQPPPSQAVTPLFPIAGVAMLPPPGQSLTRALQQKLIYPHARMPQATIDRIGSATIDIIPHDIHYLLLSGCHYVPRPVIQSYQAYAPALDSANMRHFTGPRRPALLLVSNAGIDNRCYTWDESLTKAAIRLNYRFADTVQVDDRTPGKSLLLAALPGSHRLPVMQLISTVAARMDETVPIPADTLCPIYMTAEVSYTPLGALRKLLFQPRTVTILQVTQDEGIYHRLVQPIARSPMLMSHTCVNNEELRRFFTVHVAANKRVKAVVILTDAPDVKEEVTLRFYRFANYQAE